MDVEKSGSINPEKKEDTFFSALGSFMRPYTGAFMGSVLLSVAGVICGLFPYLYIAKIVTALLTETGGLAVCFTYAVLSLVFYLAKVVLANVSSMISHKATYKTLRDVRLALTEKLLKVPMGYLLDTPDGHLKTLLVDRVESMETPMAHVLPEMTANALVPVGVIAGMFWIDWRMALAALITLPIGLLGTMVMMRNYAEKYQGQVQAGKSMNSTLVEYINGIEVIKAFRQSAHSYKKYSEAVTHNASYSLEWMRSCQPYASFSGAVIPSTLFPVLCLGLILWNGGTLSIESFIMVIILSMAITAPLKSAANYMDNLAQVGTMSGEIKEVLDAPELRRPQTWTKLNNMDVAMGKVGFSYEKEGRDIIQELTLTIPQGTMMALVGPSGGGKSTIARLIAGFWDVDEGQITIGGVPYVQIPQEQLNRLIAYVEQDNFLFDMSIRENIRVGNPSASDAQIEQIARDAGCYEFIAALPWGFDTPAGEAGDQLSGGEKQRISIARAMAKDAPIVIMDEATAFADPENEKKIQDAVSKLIKGKTLIVIAHRLSTIVSADQILVVQEGRIESKGTHEELMKSSSLYKAMWEAHSETRDEAEETLQNDGSEREVFV